MIFFVFMVEMWRPCYQTTAARRLVDVFVSWGTLTKIGCEGVYAPSDAAWPLVSSFTLPARAILHFLQLGSLRPPVAGSLRPPVPLLSASLRLCTHSSPSRFFFCLPRRSSSNDCSLKLLLNLLGRIRPHNIRSLHLLTAWLAAD